MIENIIDIGAQGGTWTHTLITEPKILSLVRLPVSPLEHIYKNRVGIDLDMRPYPIALNMLFTHLLIWFGSLGSN